MVYIIQSLDNKGHALFVLYMYAASKQKKVII